MPIRSVSMVLAVMFACGFMPVSWAQSDGEDPNSTIQVVPDFYNTPKVIESTSNVMGDADISVDPHSGTLTIAHTDLYVPGDGGFDLKLTRYYHSLQPQAFNHYSPVGVGWSMHFGMIKTSRPNSMCDPLYNANLADNPVYIAPDGSQRPLAIGVNAGSGGPGDIPDSEYFTYITQRFDVVYCKGFLDPDPSNDELWLRTPDGRKYEFTSRFLDPLKDSPAIWYVNKITDANGNYLEIEYQSSGVEGNSGQLIDSIETSDGRQVDFVYDSPGSKGPRLSHILYEGHQWKYGYESSEVNHDGWPQSDYFLSSNLVSVTTPDNDKWEYDYNGFTDGKSGGEGCIRDIQNPYGGNISVSYQVEKVYEFDALNYILNRMVTNLTEEGRNTYDYSYTRDASGDTTTVSSDIGDTTYSFHGLRSVSDGEVWKIGIPKEVSFDPVSGPSSSTVYNYDRIPISTENEVRRERIGLNIPEDEFYYYPMLVGETFQLDGETWEKSYDYGDAQNHIGDDSWFLFAPPAPEEVAETGPAGPRTIQRSYQAEPDKYLWNLVRGEKGIKTGPSGAVYEYFLEYDTSGNVIDKTDKARSISFSVDSVGNRTGSITDTGESTSYSQHELGIAGRIVTPTGMVIDRDIDDFGRVESTSYEGRTQSVSRDIAGRIESITPVQGLPATVSWSSNGATLTRGDLTHTYGFDEYGRVTSESISGLGITTVNISRDYDVQDNVTSETVNGSTVSYDYDGYGRLTSINDNGAIRSISYSDDEIFVTNEKGGLTTYYIRSYTDPFTYEYMGVVQDGGVSIDLNRNIVGDVLKVSSGGKDRVYDYAGGYFYPVSYAEPETGRVEFVYDEGGRVTHKLHYGRSGSASPLKTQIIQYDDAGRVSSEVYETSDRQIVNSYSYDTLSQLVSATRDVYDDDELIDSVLTDYTYSLDGSLTTSTTSVDDKVFDISYGYDGYRNRDSITYPSGDTYQLNNNPLGQTISYDGFVNDAEYNYTGTPSVIRFTNGDVYSSALNQRRLPSSMQVNKSNQDILKLVYYYDDAANITTITDEVGSQREATASYDDYSRLIYASSGSTGYGYIYDDVNNISAISKNGVNKEYSYSSDNLLISTEWSEEKDYSYNAFGDIVQFGAMPQDGVEIGTDFFWTEYNRHPDGSIRGIYNYRSSYAQPLYLEGNAYLYDHRGYMVRKQSRYSALSNAQIEDVGEPLYKIYNDSGKLVYEYDDGTGLSKEYHYLAGRLIGLISEEYSCSDDPDGDGMPYCFEEQYGLDNNRYDASLDPDEDGLTNLEEYLASTDPTSSDTDSDRIPDGWEYENGLDPTQSNEAIDSDGDGFTDYQEYAGGYDPATANLPHTIPAFSLAAGADGIDVRWDRSVSPSVKLYIGDTSGSLSLYGEISDQNSTVAYSSLPSQGYMAIAAFNNEGETQRSSLRYFSNSEQWGSFSSPVSDGFVTYLNQHGLLLAADQSDFRLKAFRSGSLVDDVVLDSPVQEDADYEPEFFQTGVLPNGDIVTVWVTQDPAHKIYGARYCIDTETFCESGELYRTDLTIGSSFEYASTIDRMEMRTSDGNVTVVWREDQASVVEEQVKAMSFKSTLSEPHVINLDGNLPEDDRAYTLSVVAGPNGNVWAARTLCCLNGSGTDIYVSKWTPSSGWAETERAYSLPDTTWSIHDIELVLHEDGAPLLLFEDEQATSIRILKRTPEGWQEQGGELDLSQSSYWAGNWRAVSTEDRLYLATEEDGEVSVHSSLMANGAFSFSSYPVEYEESIQSMDLRSMDGSAVLLVSGESMSSLVGFESSGPAMLGFLPVSGTQARFVAANDDAYLSLATESYSDHKASVMRSQLVSATPIQVNVTARSPSGYNEMGPLKPGGEAQVCAQWSVNSLVDQVELEQISGPSLMLAMSDSPCVAGTVPYLAQPGNASFEAEVSVAADTESGQGTVDIPAFEPHIVIDSDGVVTEGQSMPLSVSALYSEGGDYYDGPLEVVWTQISGPPRTLLPERSDGTRAILWAPDVNSDTAAQYQADVYFPEADIVAQSDHSITIQDSGNTVVLPPEIDVAVEPYSQYGYDMQRVTVTTDRPADITMRLYGSWSMLQDGNEPTAIPSGSEPEPGFNHRYQGPFSAILQPGQEINGTIRAETDISGRVSYYSFHVAPPPIGPIEPEVTIDGPLTAPDGDAATFTAVTLANSSGAVYDGPIDYTWQQLGGPQLGIAQWEDSNPLTITMPETTGSQDATLQVEAYLPDEGMAVTAQKTFSIVDDESSGGQAPEITWTVEPYSAYGYDLNRVTLDAGDATVHMKIYGSWTMLSDGNQPTQVPSGSEPEPNYQYEYVAPFSILREPNKEMDITIRAQSPTSGLISYDRVIVDQNGGTAAPVN